MFRHYVFVFACLAALLLMATPPVQAITWVKINGQTNATITANGTVELTADCTPGGEVIQAMMIYDANANGVYEPGTDEIVDSGELYVDNSWIDENAASGLIKYTISAVDTGEMIGKHFILVFVELANSTHAQATFTVNYTPTVTAQGVQGHVENHDGSPAAGAVVFAARPNVDPQEEDVMAMSVASMAIANAQGNYTLYVSQAGPWGVGVLAEDSDGNCTKKLMVPAATFLQNTDFTLPPLEEECDGDQQTYYTVSGIVTDTQDRPLPGVEINWSNDESEVYAGLDGSYSIQVPPGQIEFYPHINGYVPSQNYSVNVTGNTTLNMTMRRAQYRVQGTIRNSTNNAAVPLMWTYATTGQYGDYYGWGDANALGRYMFWVDAGTYNFIAEGYSVSQPFENGSEAVTVNGNVTRDITVIPRSAVVTGTVRDGSSSPIGFAYVMAENTSRPGAVKPFTVTAANGTYSLLLTPGDTYDIGYYKPGYMGAEQAGYVGASGTVNKTLTFISDPPTLSGISVTPTSGTADTEFVYEVTYKDANNDPPSGVTVEIDGSSYSMTRVDSNSYSAGTKYQYATNLSMGSHWFLVSASDDNGVDAEIATCESEWNQGPCVSTAPAAPENTLFDPFSGSYSIGGVQAFTCAYTDANGATDIAQAKLIINTTQNGVNAISVMYDQNENKLYLRNDANTSWGTGYAPQSSNVLQNSQCKVYCSESSVNLVGNDLSVTWSIEPKVAMAGKSCSAYLYVSDDGSLFDGWDAMGTANFAAGPVNVSLTPNSGTFVVGVARAVAAKYSDPDGASNLSQCVVLVNATLDPSNGLQAKYDANENKLYLSDGLNGWTGGYAPGSAEVIENEYARLHCGSTTVSTSGNELTISFSVEVLQAPPTEEQPFNVWMFCIDDQDNTDGWDEMGSFTFNTPPQTVAIIPDGGTFVTGLKYEITSEYLELDGPFDVASCRLLMNTSLNGANCINLMYDQEQDKLYVRNDGNTAWLGGYAPGSANVIENSYCKLYCAETTVSSMGTVSIAWKIEPKPGMNGKTCGAWLMITDARGATDGWDKLGGQFIFKANSAPQTVSIAPTSGTYAPGTKQTFTCQFRDPDGYENLTECRLLVNAALDGAKCINVMYDRAGDVLYVRNDANTAWVGGFAPGTPSVIENGYCKLYCAETTAADEGLTETVAFRIEAKPAFSGKACKAWLKATDQSGAYDGWDQYGGTYKFNRPPATGAISPTTTSLVPGTKKTITSAFTDPDGYANLKECRLLMNTSLNGANTINVMYNANENKLYVRNDANTGWVGGYAPGTANVVENGYCKLYCANTNKSGSGTTLTVNWSIEAKPTMAGKNCSAWLRVTDDCDAYDGWDQVGTLFKVNGAPTNGTLTPTGGVLQPAYSRDFVCKYSDANGYADLAECRLLINTTLSGANAIHVMYDANANKLYVRNDANTAWLGGTTPGEGAVIENSYCRLHTSSTIVSGSGNTLTITWDIEPKQAISPSMCKAYLYCKDDAGATATWLQRATYKFSSAPRNVSISPTSGTFAPGDTQSFGVMYYEDDGYANMATCQLLINTTLTSTNGISVMYNANTNTLWLRSDDNSEWLGGYEPGSANTIENSQCIIDCADTSVGNDANRYVIAWSIQFKDGMSGKDCRAWLRVMDDVGLVGNWGQFGGSYKIDLAPTTDPVSIEDDLIVGSINSVYTYYYDEDGYGDLTECRLLINSVLSGANAIHVLYDPKADKLYVRNDANTAWMGGYAPGAPFTVGNNYCELDCFGTQVIKEDTQITVIWAIQPKEAIVGDQMTWTRALDDCGLTSGWIEGDSASVIMPPM